MTGHCAAFIAVGISLVAGTAYAQPAATPPRLRQTPQLSAFVDIGRAGLAADGSTDAVLRRSALTTIGAGGRLVWRSHLYAEARVGWMHATGERVYEDGGIRFGLGIPLEIRLVPADVTVGYQFSERRRVRPFLGVGGGAVWYREESKFSADDENMHEAFGAYHVTAGADIRVSKWIGIGGAVVIDRVPGALGRGGVSRDRGELDLGGTSLHLRATIRP